MSDTREAALPWARWEPLPLVTSGFGGPQREDAGAVAASSAAVTALRETLDAEREAAFAQASERGYEAGFRTGLAEGRRQGHEKGLEQGLAEGLKKGKSDSAAQAKRLARLADACAQAVDTFEQDMGQAILDLAVHIAEHVLHDTLAQRPETLHALLAEVLRLDGLGDAGGLQLLVHPQDKALAQEFLAQEAQAGRWQLIADERLTPGGCRVRSTLGDIDATLENRWRQALASLGK